MDKPVFFYNEGDIRGLLVTSRLDLTIIVAGGMKSTAF